MTIKFVNFSGSIHIHLYPANHICQSWKKKVAWSWVHYQKEKKKTWTKVIYIFSRTVQQHTMQTLQTVFNEWIISSDYSHHILWIWWMCVIYICVEIWDRMSMEIIHIIWKLHRSNSRMLFLKSYKVKFNMFTEFVTLVKIIFLNLGGEHFQQLL